MKQTCPYCKRKYSVLEDSQFVCPYVYCPTKETLKATLLMEALSDFNNYVSGRVKQ